MCIHTYTHNTYTTHTNTYISSPYKGNPWQTEVRVGESVSFYWGYLQEEWWRVAYKSRADSEAAASQKALPGTGEDSGKVQPWGSLHSLQTRDCCPRDLRGAYSTNAQEGPSRIFRFPFCQSIISCLAHKSHVPPLSILRKLPWSRCMWDSFVLAWFWVSTPSPPLAPHPLSFTTGAKAGIALVFLLS